MTHKQAELVINEVIKMPQFQPPAVNSWSVIENEGEPAIKVSFVSEKPENVDLPDHISGVKMIYRFNCGEITPLKVSLAPWCRS